MAKPTATATPRGPKHGPFFYLNRCFAKGQMQSLLLKSPDQVDQARQSLAAYAQVQGCSTKSAKLTTNCSAGANRSPRPLDERTGSIFDLRHQGFRLEPGGARRCATPGPIPKIPTRPLLLSLLLGVVIRAGSYLDIAKQTKRRRWQHLIHWPKRISDDAFHYVSERFYLEDLRQGLVGVNQRLKGQQGAGKL